MTVNYRIVHSFPTQISRHLISYCANNTYEEPDIKPDTLPKKPVGTLTSLCPDGSNCKLIDLGNIPPPWAMFPRSYCTILRSIKYLLLDRDAVGQLDTNNNGWSIFASDYGDSARLLVQGDLVLACERLIKENNSLDAAHLDMIRKAGMRVGYFPTLLATKFSRSAKKPIKICCNDHIDRGAVLIKGKDGKLYLVIDPMLATADWSNPADNNSWTLRSPNDTKAYLKRLFEPMGITVCWPRKITVPYALNLKQFDSDGRVLMTGGDRDVYSLIASLVRKRNVFVTSIPIKYFPVWLYGGIGCLLGEIPNSLIKFCGGIDKPIWLQ